MSVHAKTRPASRSQQAPWWATPVTAWAVVGATFLLSGTWVMTRWALADIPHTLPRVTAEVSAARQILLWGSLALAVVPFCGLVVWLVRQCRKEPALTLDAMLFLAYTSAFWLGPIGEYEHWTAHRSRFLPGVTSWGPYIPGWHSQTPERQIDLWFTGLFGYSLGMMMVLIMAALMRGLFLRKWPGLHGPKFVLAALLCGLLTDFLSETPFILAGNYAYVAAVPELTIMAGHWYQIPLYEYALVGIFWVGIPCIIRFHGGAPILNGSGRLPHRLKTPVQAMAVIGMVNVCVLCWLGSFAIINLIADPAYVPDIPLHLR
ncbi:spirocyclase, AveC family [Nonomuraea turkmeniaca]|uniref:Spirocyclase, AveC family n=1 Tax=Nonomuraea turkmeniaca TaxID=103838 RepID=A0A5S4EZ04_9ACTN|nr:spirocyclase AveC family protein [Nonomuraea turkmeniaca]TMR08975.1 spirocyclase, AveC family [Nonomuraea turkmeniaca]